MFLVSFFYCYDLPIDYAFFPMSMRWAKDCRSSLQVCHYYINECNMATYDIIIMNLCLK